ncbi:Imm49 family immunity protein [Psychromonas aquimarina]|uniref:Imm49 family immunity protein n=1 Tax=Psychromonas aquimarina TaxID=444919 RepID=UPI000420C5C9|nr:Imm49 family immunity protein [Psychromonas aquimarina]
MSKIVDLNKKIPFHLERVKGYGWVYNQQLDGLNRVLSGSLSTSRNLLLLSVSTRHQRLASLALHNAGNSERAFVHLQQMHYLGIKGLKRELLSDGQTVNVKVLEDTLMLSMQEKEPLLSSGDWFMYFWSALLHEQFQDLEYLASIKEAPFRWIDDSIRLYSDILCGVFKLQDINVQESIQAFVDASEFDKVSPESYDHAAHIKLPTLDVLLKLFGGADQNSYRQVMYKAALAHNKFWKQKRLDGKVNGDISLPLSALARLAYANFGYTLGFECDYIPEYFYKSEASELSFELMQPLPNFTNPYL